MSFYLRLKNACRDKDITLTDLCKTAGISRSNIQWRKNGAMPRYNLATRLAEILCVPVDQLITDSCDMSSAQQQTKVSVNNCSIQNNQGVVGVGAIRSCDPSRDALLEIYDSMTPIQRARLLIAASEMANEPDRIKG